MGPKDRLHATDTERIDQAMFESFPASDSPAWTLGSPGEGVEEIPDFRLPASTGQTLAKSAFIGKMPIVLIFVSDLSTDESVATLTAFNDALAQFGHRVSQVLGVARMTARLAREAAERHSINFQFSLARAENSHGAVPLRMIHTLQVSFLLLTATVCCIPASARSLTASPLRSLPPSTRLRRFDSTTIAGLGHRPSGF